MNTPHNNALRPDNKLQIFFWPNQADIREDNQPKKLHRIQASERRDIIMPLSSAALQSTRNQWVIFAA